MCGWRASRGMLVKYHYLRYDTYNFIFIASHIREDMEVSGGT